MSLQPSETNKTVIKNVLKYPTIFLRYKDSSDIFTMLKFVTKILLPYNKSDSPYQRNPSAAVKIS